MNKSNQAVLVKRTLFAVALVFPFITTACADPVSSVPVYQGMTIAKNGTTSAYRLNPALPQGESSNTSDVDITSIVTPTVTTDPTVKYYVSKGEVFTVQVHLSNPKDFEIQSFTLNGKKYANYMFKSGSTLDLLLLDVTAPQTSGYVDYTIDAIKYIDGTEIKDVKMDGEKTIQAGVKYDEGPTATIDSITKSTTSLAFKMTVTDQNKIIGTNPITFYVSDAKKVIAQQSLVLGSQEFSVKDLIMGQTYGYGIEANYDLIDGKDIQSHWLVADKTTTSKAFSIVNVKSDKTSISFDIQKEGSVGTITSVDLYDKTKDAVDSSLASLDDRKFTGLLSDHAYQIRVNFTYKSNDKDVNDYDSYDIATVAKAAPEIKATADTTTQTSIAYALDITDPDAITSIKKVELFKDKTLIATMSDLSKKEFENLLSDTAYTLVVTYSYDLNDGTGEQSKTLTVDAKTLAKSVPSVAFKNQHIDSTTVSGTIEATDPDNIYHFIDVKLFDAANTLIATSTDPAFSFTGLSPYTNYTVKADYSYDLNNGAGNLASSKDLAFKTSPSFEFTSVSVLNTTAVSDGDVIVLQAAINNPSNATYDKVTINGKAYTVSSSSRPNFMRVEIKNEGQFAGGLTTLTIESVSCLLNGENFTITPTAGNTASVFVNGALTVKSMQAAKKVGTAYEIQDHLSQGEDNYFMLTLDNPTGYTIDSVAIAPWHGMNVSNNVYSASSISMIDQNHAVVKAEIPTYSQSIIATLASISYSNSSISKTVNYASIAAYYMPCASSQVIEISTPNQLLSQSSSVYCKLSQDLDFTGIDWNPVDFVGVLDGNNHEIKNLHCVKTIGNSDFEFGLFKHFDGVIKNIALSDYIALITLAPTDGKKYNCRLGGFASLFSGRAVNCISKDSTGVASVSFTGAAATDASQTGGLFGISYGASIEECRNETQISGFSEVGGIIGSLHDSLSELSSCTNTGFVSGSSYIGGIVGSSYGPFIISCSNSGPINSSTSMVGGIAGFANGGLLGCTNTGMIKGVDEVGGMVGCVNQCTVSDSTNRGEVKGTSGCAGGIIGDANISGVISANRCSNFGAVSSNHYAGGIAGNNAATIRQCVNGGAISIDDSGWYAGGICGMCSGLIDSCLNFGSVASKQGLKGGIAYASTTTTNCLFIGSNQTKGLGEVANTNKVSNCFRNTENSTDQYLQTASEDKLNSASFYTDTLGWDANVWDLTNLDVANGHYPTLR
jgi:hypothetical protein